ncbi:G-protein coupled receptor moody [Plakobranchus ocellatus]|uniref:G-protein coupled receptor moody n=1 Tax=Plakobranchus ocellatus TaxID=259542 RepID=A0AAV4D564_9GAST|nr:G-protein coupled receptor moody [Plakobranchus ocellatus]
MCSPNYTNTMFHSDFRTAHVVSSLTLATLGTTGNALSIGLICSAGLQHSAPTIALILGMCTANLISTSLLLPVVAASNIHGDWFMGDIYCLAYGYIVYVTLTAESLQIVAITLAQYLTVVHRVTSNKLRRHLPELVAGPWVFACLIYLMPLTGVWESFGYDPRRGYCTLVSAKGSGGGKSGDFMSLLSALFIALMTLVNVYCYSAILYVTHKSRKRISNSVLEAAARFKGRGRDMQLLRMTAIIFANFGLTYLPFLVLLAIDPCLEQISPTIFTVVLYISWSHATTNPVIYALLNTKIKRLWLELFCCRSSSITRGKTHAAAIWESTSRIKDNALRLEEMEGSGGGGREGEEGIERYTSTTEHRRNSTPLLHQRNIRKTRGKFRTSFRKGASFIVIVEAMIPDSECTAYTDMRAFARDTNTQQELEQCSLSDSEV